MFGLTLTKKQAKKIEIIHQHVVIIDRDKCIIISYPEEHITMCQYPPSQVLDGDVIDRELFRGWMVKWVQTSGLKPTEVIYVVSPSICFKKDFTPETRTLTGLSNFIDSVPFQKVVAVQLTTPHKTKLLVTNRELLNGVTYSFDMGGFVKGAVFPYEAIADMQLPQLGDATKNIIAIGRIFIELATQKGHELFEFDVDKVTEAPKRTVETVAELSRTEVNPMVAVVAVLVMMMMGGGVMYWQYASVRRAQPSEVVRVNPRKAPDSNTLPSPGAELVTAKTTGKIEIQHASLAVAFAQTLKASLESAGYEVSLTELTDTTNRKNTITYSDKSDAPTQKAIADVLTKSSFAPDITAGPMNIFTAIIQLIIPPGGLPTATPIPVTSSAPTAPPSNPSATLEPISQIASPPATL
ncbi:MAG: hypothetical protein WCJ70_04160 [bacterium]